MITVFVTSKQLYVIAEFIKLCRMYFSRVGVQFPIKINSYKIILWDVEKNNPRFRLLIDVNDWNLDKSEVYWYRDNIIPIKNYFNDKKTIEEAPLLCTKCQSIIDESEKSDVFLKYIIKNVGNNKT